MPTARRSRSARWITPRTRASVRSTWTCIGLYVLTFGFYTFYWYYRIHEEHPRRARRDPPARVVMFHMLVPITVFMPMLCISALPSGARFDQATTAQRVGWCAAMGVAFYSHVVFAFFNYRLSERFDELARERIGPTNLRARGRSVVAGIAIMFVGTFVPRLDRWNFVDLPDWVLIVSSAMWGFSVAVTFYWWKGINDTANALASPHAAER